MSLKYDEADLRALARELWKEERDGWEDERAGLPKLPPLDWVEARATEQADGPPAYNAWVDEVQQRYRLVADGKSVELPLRRVTGAEARDTLLAWVVRATVGNAKGATYTHPLTAYYRAVRSAMGRYVDSNQLAKLLQPWAEELVGSAERLADIPEERLGAATLLQSWPWRQVHEIGIDWSRLPTATLQAAMVSIGAILAERAETGNPPSE